MGFGALGEGGEGVGLYLLTEDLCLGVVLQNGVDAVEVEAVVVALDLGAEGGGGDGVDVCLKTGDGLRGDDASGTVELHGVVDDGADALHEVVEVVVIGITNYLDLVAVDGQGEREAAGEWGGGLGALGEGDDDLAVLGTWGGFEIADGSFHFAFCYADDIVFLVVDDGRVNESYVLLLALDSADEEVHLDVGDGDVVGGFDAVNGFAPGVEFEGVADSACKCRRCANEYV